MLADDDDTPAVLASTHPVPVTVEDNDEYPRLLDAVVR